LYHLLVQNYKSNLHARQQKVVHREQNTNKEMTKKVLLNQQATFKGVLYVAC